MTAPAPAVPFRGALTRALEAQLGLRESADLAQALSTVVAAPDAALPVAAASTWPTGAPDPRTLGAAPGFVAGEAARPAPGASTPIGTPDPRTVAAMTDRVQQERGTPWPQPRASDAARYHGDGDRIAWETPAFARQERLTRTAIAATADPTLLADVVDGVTLLCEQSSWCWPAHDDTFAKRGAVLATVTDPYLDLGAGEVVGQLAWIDQLLGDQLDQHYPGVRARIRHEAHNRVFEPFERRRDWHWLGLDGDAHNWNPWIHGNVLVAALRLLDGPDDNDRRTRILTLVVEGLDRYVSVLPHDGAIDEGYAYWWNGACRLLEALDLLTHATRGAIDPVPSIPALRETIAFPHRMHLGNGWFVNAADGQAKPTADQPWHSLHRAAIRAGDTDAQRFAAAHRQPNRPATTESEGLGRVLRGITDAAWLRARPSAPPAPAATWLSSTHMLVARERDGTASGLTLAVKGGHNDEHHNHNDIGNVLVASDGTPVIVDAGRPSYDARTFSDRRYELWPMQSEWHNVPLIAGRGQPNGPAFAAEVISAQTAPSPALELELAGAYEPGTVDTWRRHVTLDRERREVRIHDAWRLPAGAPGAAAPSAAAPSAAAPSASAPGAAAPGASALAPTPAPAPAPAPESQAPATPTKLWQSAAEDAPNNTSPQLSAADSTSPQLSAADSAATQLAAANSTVRQLSPASRTTPAQPAPPPPTQVRLLLAGDVARDTQSDDTVIVTPIGGGSRVYVTWSASAAATLTPIDLDDPMLADVWGPRLVRLDLDVADRSTMTVTVRQEHPTPLLGETGTVGDAA
ncbi:heparinase II/III domain-containing protein [Pseudoclavibacter helvolus]|uniref:heparinase II/III domain-containing protein n=1 Tax=Pseudoclavibacter helvolus TaxID=255205 RepID=UPI003C750289